MAVGMCGCMVVGPYCSGDVGVYGCRAVEL